MQTETLSTTHVAWPFPATELKPALELALALARADMAVLMLHDDAAGALFPALGQGMTDDECALIGTHRAGVGPLGIAVSEHRRVIVKDARHSPELSSDLARKLGFRGIEVIPLFGTSGQTLGEIVVMFRHTHGSNRRLGKFVEQCAQLVVLAILQARLRLDAEHARENAEQSGRAKIQFLARMSHELRTPLQSIAGYIDLLAMGGAEPLSPAQARLLDRVRESEQVLVHVIDDLITFSRIEAGHVAYHIGPVLAQEALRVTEAVVSPLATDRGVLLEVVDAPRGTLVSADGDKLKQVLVNLAANAVKFTKRGGMVRLTAHLDAESVIFDVSDTGPGIPAEQLRDIFEPYVQLSTSLLDRFGGSGLGLAISREFADGMHGDLTVKSDVGHGSTFSLRLPKLALAEKTAPVAGTSTRPARSVRANPPSPI